MTKTEETQKNDFNIRLNSNYSSSLSEEEEEENENNITGQKNNLFLNTFIYSSITSKFDIIFL